MKKSSKVTAVILSAILAMSMIGCGSSYLFGTTAV